MPNTASTPDIERGFDTIEPSGRLYVVGVDIGKKRDWTAITVLTLSEGWRVALERTPFQPGPRERGRRRFATHAVAHIERPPLGTPYPAIAQRVCALIDALPPMPLPPALVVDATGVGQPIVDLFRSAGLRPVAITITGGSQVVRHGGHDISVPKKVLMENVKALIQDGRLKVARALSGAADLQRELAAFGQTIGESGQERFGGVGQHDDIVLSLALSAWYAETLGRPAEALRLDWMAR